MLDVLPAVDYMNPPADYADFYELYYGHILAIVRKSGIDTQSADDIADEIFIRLIEIDIIDKFDIGHIIIHDGELILPRFKSFLDAHVKKYILGKREKLENLNRREILICDTVVDDYNTRWIDNTHTATYGSFSDLEERHLIESIRSYLSTLPPRSTKDICNLVKLFDAVVEQIHSFGKHNVKDLQLQFGVSKVAIYSWLKLLRKRANEALQ